MYTFLMNDTTVLRAIFMGITLTAIPSLHAMEALPDSNRLAWILDSDDFVVISSHQESEQSNANQPVMVPKITLSNSEKARPSSRPATPRPAPQMLPAHTQQPLKLALLSEQLRRLRTTTPTITSDDDDDQVNIPLLQPAPQHVTSTTPPVQMMSTTIDIFLPDLSLDNDQDIPHTKTCLDTCQQWIKTCFAHCQRLKKNEKNKE